MTDEEKLMGAKLMNGVTLSVSITCPPEEVYQFASDPENLPKWATSFIQSIRRSGTTWLADTTDGTVQIRFAPTNALGVLDHYVTLEDGQELYVPMRVVPNGSGSEVLFTLFQTPSMSAERLQNDRRMIEQDLTTLKQHLEAAHTSAGLQTSTQGAA